MLVYSSIYANTPFKLSNKTVQEGAKLILVNDYEKADLFWNRVIKEKPELPDGYFFILMNMHVKMIDFENYDESQKFEQYCDTVIAIAGNYSEKTANDYYVNFYSGVIHFYQAFIYSKMNKNINAFLKARAGAKELERCMAIDSSIYEPYPLLGAYKYWKSKKAGFLRAIKFIKDERKLGLEYLEKGIEKSVALNVFARDQLAWIYIDKGEPNKALGLTSANLKDFNNSRSLKWTYSHSLLALQYWEKALKEFILLHLQYKELLPQAEYNYLYTFNKIITLKLKDSLKQKNSKQIHTLIEEFQKWRKNKKNNLSSQKILEEIDKKLQIINKEIT